MELNRNPKFFEHDANGFRNDAVPTQADVVTIGDSFTYGWSVSSEQSWPRVLENITRCRVYNMGFGGYGPIQYLSLANMALEYRPRTIIVGVFLGNDLADSWIAYSSNPSNYPVPDELSRQALEREGIGSYLKEEKELDVFAMQNKADEEKSKQKLQRSGMRFFVSQNLALWGLARALKNQFSPPPKPSILAPQFKDAVDALKPEMAKFTLAFQGGDWKTILNFASRAKSLNVDDPRIKVGFWLTKWAIKNINELARKNGVKPLFVIFPTKETVFAPRITNRQEHKLLDRLVTGENAFREDLIKSMTDDDIPYFDMTAVFREMKQQPYFENADGHLNEAGNTVVASSLKERIGRCR
jgi:hypothetical protein